MHHYDYLQKKALFYLPSIPSWDYTLYLAFHFLLRIYACHTRTFSSLYYLPSGTVASGRFLSHHYSVLALLHTRIWFGLVRGFAYLHWTICTAAPHDCTSDATIAVITHKRFSRIWFCRCLTGGFVASLTICSIFNHRGAHGDKFNRHGICRCSFPRRPTALLFNGCCISWRTAYAHHHCTARAAARLERAACASPAVAYGRTVSAYEQPRMKTRSARFIIRSCLSMPLFYTRLSSLSFI